MIRNEVLIDGSPVAYWELNTDSLKTLIMLHGFRGSREGLKYVAAELSEYHLIIPDRPGYGESGPLFRRHSLENYANWLGDLISELGLSRYALWGHSYGASIALMHAAQSTTKPLAVIGVNPALLRGGMWRRITTCYYRSATALSPSLAKRWLASSLLERATDSVVFRTPRSELPPSLAGIRLRERLALRPQVIIEEYLSPRDLTHLDCDRLIEVPVLLITGDKDVLVSVRKVKEFQNSIPTSQLHVLKNGGHMLPIERAREVAELSRHFLDDLWRLS